MEYNTLTQKVIYTAPLVDPTQLAVVDLTPEEIQAAKDRAMSKLRAQRNSLLADSDYTQLPDFKGDAAAWSTYRQALRDLPATIEDARQPHNWPAKP